MIRSRKEMSKMIYIWAFGVANIIFMNNYNYMFGRRSINPLIFFCDNPLWFGVDGHVEACYFYEKLL